MEMRLLQQPPELHYLQLDNKQKLQSNVALQNPFSRKKEKDQQLEANMNAQNTRRVLLKSHVFLGFFGENKLALSSVSEKTTDKTVHPNITLR